MHRSQFVAVAPIIFCCTLIIAPFAAPAAQPKFQPLHSIAEILESDKEDKEDAAFKPIFTPPSPDNQRRPSPVIVEREYENNHDDDCCTRENCCAYCVACVCCLSVTGITEGLLYLLHPF